MGIQSPMYPAPPLEEQALTAAEAEMAKRNSVGSHDMPRQNAFRPAYGTAQDSDDDNSCMASIITFVSYLLVFITLPISIWGCVKVVQEYERAVIFRLGRLRSGGAKGPGLFFALPCIDTYRCVDLRTGAFDVPPQEILTRDSVTVSVEIKDVRLPQQMQRAMAAEAESTRDARAKVIASEGEQKAAKALKEAADVVSQSPAAL